MIRRTLLIGLQEFVKYVTRRGFIISLLMIPAIMVLAIAVPQFTATHPRTTVMTVVDLEGGYAEAIAAAAARDRAQAELQALAMAKQYSLLLTGCAPSPHPSVDVQSLGKYQLDGLIIAGHARVLAARQLGRAPGRQCRVQRAEELNGQHPNQDPCEAGPTLRAASERLCLMRGRADRPRGERRAAEGQSRIPFPIR